VYRAVARTADGTCEPGGIFPKLDCFDLALGAIDFVVDHMGFDTGADPEAVVGHLFGEIVDWVPDAAEEEAEAAARAINEVLIRPQRGLYSEPDDPTRRPFDFALLREEPAPEGIRITATDEAVNVLVGALDTEVASAVAAAEAKLESLLSRRRFGEAEQAARDARIRSIQWMAEVRRIIADTRLDVRRAGWDQDIPAKLNEIIDDLAKQMVVERRMLEAMRHNRDTADRPDLAQSTQRLIAVVEDCLNRHRELHSRVMDASEAFFVEHARQAFQPRSSLRAVDLYEQLFLPVMRGRVGEVTAVVEAFASGSWGIADLRLASMKRLFDVLLADPRTADGLGEELPNDQLIAADDPRRFRSEAWSVAQAVLDELEMPKRLSALLGRLRAAGNDTARELLGLLALQAVDPALEQLRRAAEPVLAAADDGERLDDDLYEGADLLVGWLKPDLDSLTKSALMSNLDLTEMRELADAAGQLLRFGLSPRLRPNRDSTYNVLVLRYQADFTFQAVVRAMATGQGLTVLACDRMEGLVLAPTEDSPYRIRLADYVLLDSATIRLLHGVVQVAIAATAYPTAAALEDGTRLASVSATQVYDRVRAILDDERGAAGRDDPPEDEPELEPVWRAVRRLRAADTTPDGRDTPHNVIGAIRKALKWLEANGLADAVTGDPDTWRLRDRYRLQVLGAAGDAVDLLHADRAGYH
jgi:hypothetical protein